MAIHGGDQVTIHILIHGIMGMDGMDGPAHITAGGILMAGVTDMAADTGADTTMVTGMVTMQDPATIITIARIIMATHIIMVHAIKSLQQTLHQEPEVWER